MTAKGSNSVLVVEDDARIRQAIAMVVANAGYEVIEAVSVKTALMHLDAINLVAVVLDLRLPNGHGKRVVEELVAKRDDVPVVILSAYPDEAPVGFPVTAVLSKPTQRVKLLNAVFDAHRASTAIKELRASTRRLQEATKVRLKPDNQIS